MQTRLQWDKLDEKASIIVVFQKYWTRDLTLVSKLE